MRKQYLTTDDDVVIFVGSHVILLVLWLIGMAMA